MLLSAYVPVAVSCCTWPTFTVAGFGATAMLTSGAAVTPIVYACVPVKPLASVAVTVKVKVPAAVGVPLSGPLLSSSGRSAARPPSPRRCRAACRRPMR